MVGTWPSKHACLLLRGKPGSPACPQCPSLGITHRHTQSQCSGYGTPMGKLRSGGANSLAKSCNFKSGAEKRWNSRCGTPKLLLVLTHLESHVGTRGPHPITAWATDSAPHLSSRPPSLGPPSQQKRRGCIGLGTLDSEGPSQSPQGAVEKLLSSSPTGRQVWGWHTMR